MCLGRPAQLLTFTPRTMQLMYFPHCTPHQHKQTLYITCLLQHTEEGCCKDCSLHITKSINSPKAHPLVVALRWRRAVAIGICLSAHRLPAG